MPETWDAEMANHSAERAVLACCLQSELARTKARESLVDMDFHNPHHATIWEAMNRLDRQGMDVDPVSVMSVVRHQDHLVRILPDLMAYPVAFSAIDTHCAEVRQQAQRRRVYAEAVRTQQLCLNPDVDPLGLAASTVTRFANIRDVGSSAGDDIEAMTVEAMLTEIEDEPEWLIPGFLEKSDRFMLTGEEGLGKSHLLRQIALLGAAGLHPFKPNIRIPPVRGMIIDFENSKRQIRRRIERTYQYGLRGRGHIGLATVLAMPRSDITSDRVLNKIHRELDASQPELLVIGPLYKMSPKALQTDDEAGPVLAALDTIRDRGIALLIEAHAGHTMGAGRNRDLRPRGSSAFLGWPEFGYGMKRTGDKSAALVPWRGDRDVRDFPTSLHEVDGRWEGQEPLTLQKIWREPEDWGDLGRVEGDEQEGA